MAGDVVIVTKVILAPNATGVQAYSMPDELNGATPKAILVFSGGGVAAGGASGSDFINFCGGMSVNGGNQSYNAITSDDNTTSTNTISEWGSDAILTTAVTGAGNMRCTVSAWAADGFSLNWTTLAVGARLMPVIVVIIAGADAEVYADNINLGTGTSAIDITAPNFQPDLVLFLGVNTANASSAHADGATLMLGAATPTEQRVIIWGENDAITSGGQPCSQLRDDCAAMGINRTNGAASYLVVCDTFDSQGFSLTPSASASSHRLSYIALGLDGLGVKLLDIVAKTSTGVQAYTGAGFKPSFGLLTMSNMTAKNTAYFNQVEAVGLSVGTFDAYTNQASHSITEDDTADPTNNKQRTDAANCLQGQSRTSAFATLASMATVDTDGFTLNYSAASGTAGIGFAVLFNGPPVPPAPTRITQESLLALAGEEGDTRVTQLAMLAASRVPANIRTTSTTLLVLGLLGIPTRVTQLATLALVSYAPCLSYFARAYKLTRLDGEVFAYTDHDEDLTVAGVTYKACSSLSASATESTSTADATGDTTINGLFSDDDITEADLFAGKFDGATIEIWEVSWNPAAPTTPRRLAAGIMGRTKQSQGRFTSEALSYGGLLQQRPLLETVTPHCRFELFSARCGLVRADFLETGSVTATYVLDAFTQQNYRLFVDDTRAEAAGWFDVGKLTWLTGDNAGLVSEIKHFESGAFELWEPMPYAIQVGDTYEATPGCDFLRTTCRDKFNNVINFGGFDDVPGTDAITKSPDAKQ